MSEVKQTGKRFEFSITALNDMLTETKSVKKKLAPFLARFQKHNMLQIYQTLSYLYKCMITPKSNLTYKFNSLFALKVLFDSSDYVLVNWIEVLFLNQITQIAKYLLTHKDDGKNFFVELGYSPYDDVGIEKMGFNYVLLALEFIQVGAKVKPYRLFENSPIENKSDFSLALQQLKKLGFKPPQNLSFYKQQAIDTQISKFEQQLNSLQDQFIDKYAQFSNMKLDEYLVEEHGGQSEKNDISIVRILEGGDLFLSSNAIDACRAEVKQPQSLVTYKNALHVLHRLFINADYEAFFALHYENTLQQSLLNVLQCGDNDKSLKRGTKFLSKFKNPEESKKIYSTFLSNLQTWSLLSNAFVKEDKNLLKKAMLFLRDNLGIEFPQMENYEAERKLFEMMRERNVQRNEQLAEDVEGKQFEFQQVLKKLKQSAQKFGASSQIKPKAQQNKPQKVNISPMKNMNTPAPLSGRNESLPFAKRLNFIEDVLNRFPKESQNYEKNKAILLDFNNTFEQQLLMVPEQAFDEFSQHAFGLQKKIDVAIKLGPSRIKQQKKVQQKIQVSNFDSEELMKSAKSIPRQQKAMQSKKKENGELMIDTPVKKFEIDQPSERKYNKVEDLGYDMPINLPVVNTKMEEKQQNSLEVMKKALYAEQHQKEQSFSITQVENKHKLGFEFLNDSDKGKEHYHPAELGYNNDVVKEQVQNNWVGKKEEEQSQSRLSNRSFRRTEEISHSRKRIQEASSMKSVSKVEHFSPQSSIINDTSNFEKTDFKKKNYQLHEQDLNIPLEEQVSENYSVNKPKEFNSLSANRSSKNKGTEQINKNINISPERFTQFEYSAPQKQPFRPSEQIMPFSNVSTPLALSSMTKQNAFKDEIHNNQDYQQEELLDEDEIYPPNMSPLEESFHDIDEIEMKIKSKAGLGMHSNGELSFKNCFETDKYILQRQQEKQSKLYWLQNDSNNLVKNILLKKEKRKASTINIPQLLNEKNVKHQTEIKAVEEEKNTKIKELEGKIKNLQKESQFMKTQLTVHIEEIKSLKAYSEYDKESVGQRGYLQDVENIAAQKLSSPMKFGFSASRGFKLDASNVKENVYLDPKGKLINSKDYKQYFQKFRSEKDKKKVLKSKDLLYKDKDIQIGFMSKKQGQRLLITIFVTPQKDLEALDWTVTENDGLQIQSQPNGFISFIRARKQQKIFFTIEVNKIYYTLPEIEFAYKISSQKQSTKITLPCSFHKFFFTKEGDANFDQLFKVNERIIRGQEVPYSKRLLKSFDNLREYFQCMTVLNKGLPNSQGEVCYGGMAMYKDVKFPVRVCIKPNQFLYIQGVNNNEWRDQNNEVSSIIQYYISLLTHLLMKEID